MYVYAVPDEDMGVGGVRLPGTGVTDVISSRVGAGNEPGSYEK